MQQGANKMSHDALDRRTTDWYIDKLMQSLVFIGGISAIIFIIGIFVFITMEGMDFVVNDLDPVEFFTSEYWFPSDEDDPESVSYTHLRAHETRAVISYADF